MSREPRAVRVVDRLDEAARILWEQDCGFVPVVDGANTLVGVVTDRDICMASYTQARTLDQVPVVSVMARELTTCQPGDTLAAAMAAMAAVQVHRLPVVDACGVLVGVLSSSDLLQVAAARPAAVAAAKVLATVAAISKPRTGARDFAAEARPAPRRKLTAKKKVASAAAASATAASTRKVAKKAVKKPAKAAKKPAGKTRARRT